LESILIQDGVDEIEVVISDNASDDNTAEMVESYVQRFPGIIKYHRNAENNQDANFERALSLGNGRFLKLHNDTAVLRPNALRKIIEAIKRADKNGLLPFFMNGNGSRDFSEGVADDLDEFAAITKYWNTWIGAFGVWRKDFEYVRGLMNDKAHTKLSQTWALFSFIAKGNSVLVNNDVFFDIIPIENKGGYNIAEVFGFNYNVLLSKFHKQGMLSARIYNKARLEMLDFVNRYYFDVKNEFAFDKSGYFKWMSTFYKLDLRFYYAWIRMQYKCFRRWWKGLRDRKNAKDEVER
jgi:glycosyltransferase involved in cell wall biosynthesis